MSNIHKLTELDAYRIQAAIEDAIYGTDRITPAMFERVNLAATAVRQVLDALDIATYDADPQEAVVPVVEHTRFSAGKV